MVGIAECSEKGSTKIYCSNLSCKQIYGVVNLARECHKQFEPHCLKKVKKTPGNSIDQHNTLLHSAYTYLSSST